MRIIAGSAKGRRLFAPTNRDIRPTSDRVRESLFSILMPRITGARFLDLFCGSGANGIEALSRGAAHATFIDQDPEALRITRNNLELCRLAVDSRVIRAAIPAQLDRQPHPFDLLFADPPYAWNNYAGLFEALAAGNYVVPDGLVILETDHNTTLPDQIGMFTKQQRRRYGDTALTFFS